MNNFFDEYDIKLINKNIKLILINKLRLKGAYMFLRHKTRILVKNSEKARLDDYCRQSCGVSRFSYNLGLSTWNSMYAAHLQNNTLPKPNWYKVRDEINVNKKTLYPWMYNVSKDAFAEALKDLGEAFTRFFKNTSNYPTFKKKNIGRESFRIATTPKLSDDRQHIHLPNFGWVKLAEPVRFIGKVKSYTIYPEGDHWIASILLDISVTPILPPPTTGGIVGIDLGLITYATLSNGEEHDGIKPYRAKLKKIRRLNRKLSRKKRKSRNYMKTKRELKALHTKIAHIRENFLHKLTTQLVKTYDGFVIEDLDIKGMVKKEKYLALDIYDAAWYMFRAMLTYKCKMYGRSLKIADRFYASTQLCSSCGKKHNVGKLRFWTCPKCGSVHQRDVNAAINLKFVPAGSSSVVC